ncbi:unnamed protein product [Ixodes persulcatus]
MVTEGPSCPPSGGGSLVGRSWPAPALTLFTVCMQEASVSLGAAPFTAPIAVGPPVPNPGTVGFGEKAARITPLGGVSFGESFGRALGSPLGALHGVGGTGGRPSSDAVLRIPGRRRSLLRSASIVKVSRTESRDLRIGTILLPRTRQRSAFCSPKYCGPTDKMAG